MEEGKIVKMFACLRWGSNNDVAEFITAEPAIVRQFGRCCNVVDNPKCDIMLNPLGYAYANSIFVSSEKKRVLVSATDVHQLCFVKPSDRVSYDALSTCVHFCHHAEIFLQCARPCISSLESAIVICQDILKTYNEDQRESLQNSGRPRMNVHVANLCCILQRLELERGIYAVFWAFRQSVRGDHSGFFAVFEGVWRTR